MCELVLPKYQKLPMLPMDPKSSAHNDAMDPKLWNPTDFTHCLPDLLVLKSISFVGGAKLLHYKKRLE